MPRPARSVVASTPLVARSAAMREVDRVVRTVADKDVLVTFIGESGTGKEVLARRLHELSGRRQGPFVPINCAAIPESLFESELFGHERGAFTGASERARGKIEAADGGTLFLDEIGELPLSLQSKLLRFLETRRFMRVGGSAKITVDVRVITATLRAIEGEVEAGRFRADLFYRIQGITVRVPPLRERLADLGPLVREFVQQSAQRHAVRPPRIPRPTLAALRAHAWPGNVRELKNAVEHLCILREGKVARVRDLPESLRRAVASKVPAAPDGVEGGTVDVRLDQPLSVAIDRILRAALALEEGNRSRAARRLGVSVRTMQRYAAKTPDLDL